MSCAAAPSAGSRSSGICASFEVLSLLLSPFHPCARALSTWIDHRVLCFLSLTVETEYVLPFCRTLGIVAQCERSPALVVLLGAAAWLLSGCCACMSFSRCTDNVLMRGVKVGLEAPRPFIKSLGQPLRNATLVSIRRSALTCRARPPLSLCPPPRVRSSKTTTARPSPSVTSPPARLSRRRRMAAREARVRRAATARSWSKRLSSAGARLCPGTHTRWPMQRRSTRG